MGFPHPTVDVPGHWPEIAAEVAGVALDPDGSAARLAQGLAGDDAVAGHVCATAFVVSPDRSLLLLVRHPRLGWSNPGGHVMVGETTARAARRELEEETGLTGVSIRACSDSPAAVHPGDVDGDRPHRHWNVAWAFEADPSVALAPEPGAPVEWFGVDDLPDDASADLSTTWTIVRRALGHVG